jgi:hypothetical protein
VYGLLCEEASTDREKPTACDYIGRGIHEHGYTWGIVHENYMNSKTLTMEEAVTISECMSQADIVDNRIYSSDSGSGDSSLILPLFTHFGVVVPALTLQNSLRSETMRPGSFWTKFNNNKMRDIKIKSMSTRGGRLTSYTTDELEVFAMYMKKNNLEPLRHFEPGDLDVINRGHGGNSNKLKPKQLQTLKKQLLLLQK